jgi:heat-inducible transcriptional repressor
MLEKLSDRQKLILKAIIEEYVTTNEPIGSKVLTEKPYLQFSSATIRYEMQHLEEEGYLKKTHTSSGRVPSEAGYRYYIDHLFIRDDNVKDYYKYIDDIFDQPFLDKENVSKKLCEVISNLTGYYSALISSPSDLASVLKLEIVPLSEKEAILLIVTSSGNIQSQRIEIPRGFKMDDLLRIMSMFDNAMYGHSIYEIRDILSQEASKPRIRELVDFRDDILNFLIKAFEKFISGDSYDSGLSKLFNQPEFQERDTMQKLIKAIDGEIMKSFQEDIDSGLRIRIGSENNTDGLEDCSIITMPYTINKNEKGSIILVGPLRMNYRATIPLLEYIASSMLKLNKG